MHIVKLDATDSTNSYLKNLMLSTLVDDCTVVVTDNQLNGRGQMGSTWNSVSGKNLTFSILKYFNALSVSDRFLITISISKAIYLCLSRLNIPNLSVKWPNDILSGRSKLCGILIENVMAGDKIKSSIIGIGLNVNQINFEGIENATSLQILLGRNFVLEELLSSILEEIQNELKNIECTDMTDAILAYESLLFRKDVPTTFKNLENELFMGIIRGITHQGKLKVMLEDNVEKEFDLKELKLLY